MTNSKIHTLPGVTLPNTSLAPEPRVVKICEDLLTLAKEGKIRAIAHAYVTNRDDTFVGWELDPAAGNLLAAAIHRLAYRIEATAGEDEDRVGLPSNRE